MNIAESTLTCLVGAIDTMTPTEFSKAPGTYFTRNRKAGFKSVILLSIGALKGTTFEHSRRFFMAAGCSPDMAPTQSALTQQLQKFSSDAFPTVFHHFNSQFECKTFEGFQLLACDGTGLAFNSDWDYDCFVRGPNKYFGVHMVALYDLGSHKYVDAEIQPARLKNEYEAICLLCKRQNPPGLKRLLVADRGFGSYNFYVHAQNTDNSFLVRLSKTQAQSLAGGAVQLQQLGETFDACLNLHLVRHNRKTQYLHQDDLDSYRVIAPYTQFDHLEHVQDGEINLNIRLVCIKLENGSYEYLATNLSSNSFPPDKLKMVYRMRWGIETSFRFLKVTLGAEHFHSRKRELVIQEVWSRMILYNFCMEITNHAEAVMRIKEQKKKWRYVYRLNISEALKTCHDFLLMDKRAQHHTDIIGWILKAGYCPVRAGRNYERKKSPHGAKSFNCR